MAQMDLDLAKTEEILVQYVKNYMENSGFENLVIGMSGGLDSTVSAALACNAIGPEHVYGFSLPYGNQEVLPAQNWAHELGMNYGEISITGPVDSLLQILPINKDDSEYKLRKGNIMIPVHLPLCQYW